MRPGGIAALLVSLAGCGLSIVGAGGEAGTSGGGGGGTSGGGTSDRASGGSPFVDGGRPGSDGGGDGGRTWCDDHPGHQVCADFDDGRIGLTLSALAGAPSTIDPSRSSSSPHSLRSAAAASGATTYAFHGWSAPPEMIDIAFDAFIEGTGILQFGGIELTAPPNRVTQIFFEANWSPQGLTFLEYGDGVNVRTPVGGIATGSWHRFAVHLDLAPGAGASKVSAQVDNLLVIPLKALSGTYGNVKEVKALAGLFWSESAASVSVNIDNVTIDAR